LSGLVNETELLQKYMQKYTDLNFGLMVAFLALLIFAFMLLWVYYQGRYYHAVRTIAAICEAKQITEGELALFVKRSKELYGKKWRDYFE
jgi:hypothetical protein